MTFETNEIAKMTKTILIFIKIEIMIEAKTNVMIQTNNSMMTKKNRDRENRKRNREKNRDDFREKHRENRENQFITSTIEFNKNDIFNFEIQKVHDERVEKNAYFNCDNSNY